MSFTQFLIFAIIYSVAKHVFTLPPHYSFEKVGIRGRTYDSEKVAAKARFTLIETETGHKTKIVEKECDFLYFILEGKGVFEINNQKEACSKYDLVIIPHGTPFTYLGNLKMLLVSVPPWFAKQEETIDN